MLTSLGLHENLPLYDMTRERLMRYKTMLLRGKAPRGPKQRAQKTPTIAKKLGLIKAWLKWATANGHLEKIQWKDWSSPLVDASAAGAFDWEQCRESGLFRLAEIQREEVSRSS
jgi:hypothetical protein